VQCCDSGNDFVHRASGWQGWLLTAVGFIKANNFQPSDSLACPETSNLLALNRPVSCVRKLIFTMAEQSISVVCIYSLLFCASLLVFQDPDMDNFCGPEENTQSYVVLSLEMSVKSTSDTAIAK
jgi:hypothetical protein